MGGTSMNLNKPSNLLLLCGSGTTGCHGWVESYRNDAREFGFLVRRGVDPQTVPIISPSGLIRYLNDEGGTFVTKATLDNQ